jgi:hypothetical protein
VFTLIGVGICGIGIGICGTGMAKIGEGGNPCDCADGCCKCSGGGCKLDEGPTRDDGDADDTLLVALGKDKSGGGDGVALDIESDLT